MFFRFGNWHRFFLFFRFGNWHRFLGCFLKRDDFNLNAVQQYHYRKHLNNQGCTFLQWAMHQCRSIQWLQSTFWFKTILFTQLLAALYCKPHMNTGYLSVWVTFEYYHVLRLFVTLVMLFTPLQLPYVHYYPSCGGCARDTEENRMRKESLVEKNVAKERLSVIYTFRYGEEIKNVRRPWLYAVRNDEKKNV